MEEERWILPPLPILLKQKTTFEAFGCLTSLAQSDLPG